MLPWQSVELPGKLEAHAQGDVANFVATMRYFADMAQHINRRNVLAVKGHEAWTMRQPMSGLPCSGLTFLPGSRFEPPRAGTSASILTIRGNS